MFFYIVRGLLARLEWLRRMHTRGHSHQRRSRRRCVRAFILVCVTSTLGSFEVVKQAQAQSMRKKREISLFLVWRQVVFTLVCIALASASHSRLQSSSLLRMSGFLVADAVKRGLWGPEWSASALAFASLV